MVETEPLIEKRITKMEEKRRIVIPIGEEPETPHFDAEETLASARPVIPLASGKAQESKQVVATAPVYKRFPFLALLVIVAVSIGMAAGLGIARYRYQQRTSSPVAAQPAQAPAPNDARTATTQTPKENGQTPHLPEVKVEEKTTGDEARTDESAKASTPEKTTAASSESTDASRDKSTGDKQTEDNAKTTQPATREKKRTSDDDEESDDAPRAQRRDRRQRNKDDDDIFNVPRRVERTSEQINRIREIFEGRSQRP
jgi:hypothetical protein